MSAQTTGRRTTGRRITLLGVATLALLAAQVALWSTPAGAFEGYGAPSFFGAAGSGDGQFKEPAGVAVNDASKEVYVYDSGNLRVERLDADGSKFEGQFNGSGLLPGEGSAAPTGQLAAPASISEHAAHGTLFNLAIDNDASSSSFGDVYVVDPGHNVIDKFSATGAYLSQLTGFQLPVFGVSVDTSGDVWVVEEGKVENGNNVGTVQEFDGSLANTQIEERTLEGLRSPGVALDSEQNLYLLRGGANVVKFNKEGLSLVPELGAEGVTGLAVDTSTNDLFADHASTIARYTAPVEAGASPETIPGLAASFGLAVNSATHQLYATQREANTVALFNFGLLPDVTTGAAGEVHRTTAKLEGEVNPDGQAVTSCVFEYGPSEAYGHTIPCSALPGSGSSPVAVSAEATGLTAASTYHFRLIAGNAAGTHPGSDQTFTTPPAVENVLTEAALAVQANSATLNGSFEPNGFDTHYRFEYRSLGGSTALTPLQEGGSASEDEHVSANLSGLTPNALYVYELLAENQFGQTLGGLGFFKTPMLAPLVPGAPSAAFIADQSAVLSAKLNPEHALTHYHFEYGPCPSLTGCVGIQSTPDQTSEAFGLIGSTQEIVELAPATTYAYRLRADNEFEEEPGVFVGGKVSGGEGTFTTIAAPTPTAQTGGPSQVASTSALIAGQVNPDGLPASYSFELGIDQGSGTQYGVVFSGPAGSSTTPVDETLPLSGLQPGTTYTYRIAISSGYINNPTHTLQGASATFTTAGLPAALSAPTVMAQLPIPALAFPAEAMPPSPPAAAQKSTRAQLLARALKTCTKQPKRKRASCRAKAESKYGPAHRKKK
jgi:DNA-binding beta-propeller fold protein YncE